MRGWPIVQLHLTRGRCHVSGRYTVGELEHHGWAAGLERLSDWRRGSAGLLVLIIGLGIFILFPSMPNDVPVETRSVSLLAYFASEEID